LLKRVKKTPKVQRKMVRVRAMTIAKDYSKISSQVQMKTTQMEKRRKPIKKPNHRMRPKERMMTLLKTRKTLPTTKKTRTMETQS